MPARRLRSGAIDRLQASQLGIFHHDQGANCVRLSLPLSFKERPLLSPSQGRDHDVSGLYGVSAKRLRTRVGNPFIHIIAHGVTQIDRGTHARRHRQLKQYTNMHRSVCRRDFGSCFLLSLSTCRQILVAVVRAPMQPQSLPHII